MLIVQQKPETLQDSTELGKAKLLAINVLVLFLLTVFGPRSGCFREQLHALQNIAKLADEFLSPVFLIIFVVGLVATAEAFLIFV